MVNSDILALHVTYYSIVSCRWLKVKITLALIGMSSTIFRINCEYVILILMSKQEMV